MGEIEFRGELHTIPAGAALVLKVDRAITSKQAADIKEQAESALGPGHRVVVIGPEFTALAVGGPVPNQPVILGMDMASGPAMSGVALIEDDGSVERWLKDSLDAAGHWKTVGHIRTNVAGDSKYIPLQRLEMKDAMTDPQARWPFDGSTPLAMLPDEAEPESAAIKAAPHVAANLLKIR